MQVPKLLLLLETWQLTDFDMPNVVSMFAPARKEIQYEIK